MDYITQASSVATTKARFVIALFCVGIPLLWFFSPAIASLILAPRIGENASNVTLRLGQPQRFSGGGNEWMRWSWQTPRWILLPNEIWWTAKVDGDIIINVEQQSR